MLNGVTGTLILKNTAADPGISQGLVFMNSQDKLAGEIAKAENVYGN